MALDTVKTPPKALPSLPENLLHTFLDQSFALWTSYEQVAKSNLAGAAHAQPSVRAPQPHEHAAPAKPPGHISVRLVNPPPGTRISTRASGTAFHLDAGIGANLHAGDALWGTSFSRQPALRPENDGLVCRVPDIYAHASSNPLLDSTGFGGHSLDGLPPVIPASADHRLPVHHAAPRIKPVVPAAPKPAVSKPVDDHPGFWSTAWHIAQFGAGLVYGVVKETASTGLGMLRAGVDLTVGAPIALWSDIIHEEPPSYIPNANRVLRPLAALADKGWDYIHSDHFHPIDDTASWAWNGVKGRYEDIVGKWNSGDYFGSGKDTGETASDVGTTIATAWTGAGAALRFAKAAADLEVVARLTAKLRPPKIPLPSPEVPLPPEVPPPTAPEVTPPPRAPLPEAPPGPAEPSIDIKSPNAETPKPSEAEPETAETRKAHEERRKAEEERKRREEEEEKKKSAEFEARRQAAIEAKKAVSKKKAKPAYKPKEPDRELRPAEVPTLTRLRKLLPDAEIRKSGHIGDEYVDKDGITYDQVGNPRAADPKRFGKGDDFKWSIDKHLVKTNDFTVIDLTDFTPEQIKIIDDYIKYDLPKHPISKLPIPADAQSRIMKIGF